MFTLCCGGLLSCSQAEDEPLTKEVDIETNQTIKNVIAIANSEAERLFPAESRFYIFQPLEKKMNLLAMPGYVMVMTT